MRPENMVSVKLQRLAAGQDAIGQPLTGWTDVATIGADIRHQTGLEAIKGGAETSVVKASARVPYRTDVVAGMRLLYGTAAYEIKAVMPDLAKRLYVDLVCEVAQ